MAIDFEVGPGYQKKLDWITYAMTEPQASSDAGHFRHQARSEGDEWKIRAEKWFATNCGFADGPAEVHKSTIAKAVSKKHKQHKAREAGFVGRRDSRDKVSKKHKQHKAREGLWPSAHIPSRVSSARADIEARIDKKTAKL